MTVEQQNALIELGRALNVIVTPFEEKEILGVYYYGIYSFSAEKAKKELKALNALEIAA